MAKQKKHKKQSQARGIMGRSDIPYAQRIKMQQTSEIVINREHAAMVTLYCMSVAMNELEGIGYKRLINFSFRYKEYEDEFYEDIEVGMARAKRRMDQMGMPISGGFFADKVDGLTKRKQEVHNHSLQAIQIALIVGAVAMNDEFGFGQERQTKISERVTELTDRYSKEGEKFLLEKMEKIGFPIIDGRAMAYTDGNGNAITKKQWRDANGQKT